MLRNIPRSPYRHRYTEAFIYFKFTPFCMFTFINNIPLKDTLHYNVFGCFLYNSALKTFIKVCSMHASSGTRFFTGKHIKYFGASHTKLKTWTYWGNLPNIWQMICCHSKQMFKMGWLYIRHGDFSVNVKNKQEFLSITGFLLGWKHNKQT